MRKASETTNQENTALRAQLERISAELNQYKQKASVMANPNILTREQVPFGHAAINSISDVNFQFEFPKFGVLPGPPSKPQGTPSQPISPQQQQQQATLLSPARSQSNDNKSPPSAHSAPQHVQSKEELAKFSGVFSPSMGSSSATNASRVSMDSANSSNGCATSSPSASSNSNVGASSSCGTSPEPLTQSPVGNKPFETLTTIGEEQPTMSTTNQPFAQFANVDLSNTNLDWLAQQNGGQFDPQLFSDYREPQDNILSNPSFDDFFNDALDADFFTPYNTAPSPHKKTITEEIDAKQDADDEPIKKDMNCNQLWCVPATPTPELVVVINNSSREKLQECPNAQNGEFDLDGLCSELTKKAKCSGVGPVVGESDFDTILRKYMGKDVSSNCVAQKLGIELGPDAKVNGVKANV